jgi:aminomethyltransferase
MHPALQSEISGTTSISAQTQLDALLHVAGIAPLDGTGWIRVTGSDRVRWLNGMVTNAIQTLAPGEGCYNFVLNAQGRIQGDLTAWMLEDSILLETSRDQLPALIAHFDHFIIMDDVELTDVSAQRAGFSVSGPRAAEMIESISLPSPPASPLRKEYATWRNSFVALLHEYSPLVPRFELWSDPAIIGQIGAELIGAGALPVTTKAVDTRLRILSGTPRYGTDIRNTAAAHDLPQETAPIGVQSRALHFTKGCYLGQEIVERIHSRGNVHRTFAGFQLTGALPTLGTVLTADSDSDSHSNAKPVGELTSVAVIPLPTGPVQLALGYIRREALDRNLPLEYPGGIAMPIALPYRTLLNPASQTRI